MCRWCGRGGAASLVSISEIALAVDNTGEGVGSNTEMAMRMLALTTQWQAELEQHAHLCYIGLSSDQGSPEERHFPRNT